MHSCAKISRYIPGWFFQTRRGWTPEINFNVLLTALVSWQTSVWRSDHSAHLMTILCILGTLHRREHLTASSSFGEMNRAQRRDRFAKWFIRLAEWWYGNTRTSRRREIVATKHMMDQIAYRVHKTSVWWWKRFGWGIYPTPRYLPWSWHLADKKHISSGSSPSFGSVEGMIYEIRHQIRHLMTVEDTILKPAL